MSDYAALLEHCYTDRQREIVQALIEHGSQRKAAKALGINLRRVNEAVERIKKAAARRDKDQHAGGRVPEGYAIRGASTMIKDSEGNIQWLKTVKDNQSEAILDAIKTIADDFRGQSKATKAPKSTRADILTVYPMGDPHIGMYAWGDETGEDFDCDIAERDLTDAVDRLVEAAPPSDIAVILNLGDFFHSDTLENKTRRSGNPLDVDSRWSRVLMIGIRAMRRCIDRALEKHKQVVVRNNIGNHDEQTSQMLGMALSLYYENNKRVTVDCSPNPFWYYEFGKCLIASTHGDGVKPADLEGIMAHDRPEAWGRTLYRNWYIGHIHHKSVHEFRGCSVESFRTLAAKDAWHNAQGYRSARDMQAIVHHREYGEIERFTKDIRNVRSV